VHCGAHDCCDGTVGQFGKYMNTMPSSVPQGWDAWLGNPGGDYISPSFQIQGLTGLVSGVVPSTDPEAHCAGGTPSGGAPDAGCWMGSPAASNYSTSVIGNVSTAWIKKVVQEDAGRPFMAYIAPKAAHEPFNPAPWYIYIFYGFSSPERDDGTGRSQASELAEHTPRFSDCGRRNDDVSEQVRRLLAGRLATDGAPTGKLELLR
jgi:hypothetical protein